MFEIVSYDCGSLVSTKSVMRDDRRGPGNQLSVKSNKLQQSLCVYVCVPLRPSIDWIRPPTLERVIGFIQGSLI